MAHCTPPVGRNEPSHRKRGAGWANSGLFRLSRYVSFILITNILPSFSMQSDRCFTLGIMLISQIFYRQNKYKNMDGL